MKETTKIMMCLGSIIAVLASLIAVIVGIHEQSHPAFLVSVIFSSISAVFSTLFFVANRRSKRRNRINPVGLPMKIEAAESITQTFDMTVRLPEKSDQGVLVSLNA